MVASADTLHAEGVGHGVRLCEVFGTIGWLGTFILRATSAGRI